MKNGIAALVFCVAARAQVNKSNLTGIVRDGDLLVKQGRHEEAIPYLRSAVRDRLDYVPAQPHLPLSQIYFRMGDEERARKKKRFRSGCGARTGRFWRPCRGVRSRTTPESSDISILPEL